MKSALLDVPAARAYALEGCGVARQARPLPPSAQPGPSWLRQVIPGYGECEAEGDGAGAEDDGEGEGEPAGLVAPDPLFTGAAAFLA